MSFPSSKQKDKQVSEGYLEAIRALKSHLFSNQIIILFSPIMRVEQLMSVNEITGTKMVKQTSQV